MEAGQDLDDLIAEKVMGLKPNERLIGCPTCGYDGLYSDHSRYSTDIAAAWEVVERLQDEGRKIHLHNTGKNWVCEISLTVGGYASTAPLAICLAALKDQAIHEPESPS